MIEPGGGERIYEQTAGGQQLSWETVLVSEPPRRLVCEWLVGDTPTELEVRFAPRGMWRVRDCAGVQRRSSLTHR